MTPAGHTTPVYELTVNDSQCVQLPAEAWLRIASAVRDDVDAMASGVTVVNATPEGESLVKG
ncbi:MAG TPA: hypothetical protein VFP15_06475 [Gemmatimonadaceae bacterium]|nr:hypothetical protein [Gemmatimonadaceae bacterium]